MLSKAQLVPCLETCQKTLLIEQEMIPSNLSRALCLNFNSSSMFMTTDIIASIIYLSSIEYSSFERPVILIVCN